MILQPQLSNSALCELCHRLAVETDSGIDIRRTWQREAENARGRARPYFAAIRDAVARGDSLASAFNSTGTLFPPLFLEMAHVGEQTGTLGKVMKRLETHYRHQVQAQRTFLGAIAWPMGQLAFAIFVIGFLIWMLGIIAQRNNGQPIDILGFGLYGTRGLIIYSFFVATALAAIGAVVVAIRRGKLWTRPIQNTLMRLPVVGQALQQIALARLTWALHLMLNVEMDLRRILPLALRTTGNDYYTRHTEQIVADVGRGDPIHVAVARTQAFPSDFVDALSVAEESGRLVESMDRLADLYQQQAQLAVRTFAVSFGWLIGLSVMGIIVFLIFRLASFYFGTINDAINMTR